MEFASQNSGVTPKRGRKRKHLDDSSSSQLSCDLLAKRRSTRVSATADAADDDDDDDVHVYMFVYVCVWVAGIEILQSVWRASVWRACVVAAHLFPVPRCKQCVTYMSPSDLKVITGYEHTVRLWFS